jgi:hypothetical protein
MLSLTVVGTHGSFWPQSSIRPKDGTKKKRKNRGIFSDNPEMQGI